MRLPEILKEFRKENHLAQKEIANKLGITREYYVKIEKGRRIPSMQLIKRMAGFLTTNLFYVFPYDNEVFRKLQDEDENMPKNPHGRKKSDNSSQGK
ncbi:MAG: helix-turn-helix transcriptional regulator [Bacteroidota bacterium]|nr:helix-turn-helix transcriptional regulator [Bacteroidota bacterium]